MWFWDLGKGPRLREQSATESLEGVPQDRFGRPARMNSGISCVTAGLFVAYWVMKFAACSGERVLVHDKWVILLSKAY